MSVFNSITIYGCDVDGLGTEVPTLDSVKSLVSAEGGASQLYEVIQIQGSIEVKGTTTEYLGGFTLVANDWHYKFTPSTEINIYTEELQSIEDKMQTDILSMRYHWLLLGETDGATTEAWTKRYSTQPQAIKDSTTPLCLAVNLIKYDISFNSPGAYSKVDMEFHSRKEGTVA